MQIAVKNGFTAVVNIGCGPFKIVAYWRLEETRHREVLRSHGRYRPAIWSFYLGSGLTGSTTMCGSVTGTGETFFSASGVVPEVAAFSGVDIEAVSTDPDPPQPIKNVPRNPRVGRTNLRAGNFTVPLQMLIVRNETKSPVALRTMVGSNQ